MKIRSTQVSNAAFIQLKRVMHSSLGGSSRVYSAQNNKGVLFGAIQKGDIELTI